MSRVEDLVGYHVITTLCCPYTKRLLSNTKAGLFFQYANALGAFRAIFKDAPKPNPVSTLRHRNQDETCSLHYAGDMLHQLTDGLRKNPQIDATRGLVTSMKWDESVCTHHLFASR